ncbi:MAG: SpoIIE family protein phosphatase [Chitinivibrionales bacterium]|nr:SpoIIE family protein phosphatase [Chitinivibrionales bacterium]
MQREIQYFINSINIPACVVDSGRRIVSANADFAAMVGVDSRSMVTASLFDNHCLLESTDKQKEKITRAIAGQKRVKLSNVRARNGRGEELYFKISGVPLARLFDEKELMLLLFADRTSEKKVMDKYETLYVQEREEREKLEEFNGRLNDLIGERTRELSKAHSRLKRAYASLNEELEIAKNVQEGLIPKELPEIINMHSWAVYMPTGKVGGDLYDIIFTPRHKVAVLIFDVAGHGVPASLIAAMAKMLFSQFIEKVESPARIFHLVNKHVSRLIKTGHYLTAFLGIIDPVSHHMVYANAGHSQPIVYRKKEKRLIMLKARGSFIGHTSLADIAEYNDETVQLQTHDKLILYTDGLTEAVDEKDEMYGIKRLKTAVADNGEQPIRDFVGSLLLDLNKFRGSEPLADDFTILSIQLGDPEKILKESGFRKGERPHILVLHTLDKIEDICSRVLEDMDNNGYTGRDIRRTKLCVHEILTNAIIHGNRGDTEKKVVVLFNVDTEKVVVSAIDEGEGFDYIHLPDPLKPENLLKENGRGLFIVKKFMDDVAFNKKGNRITIAKYPEGPNGY